MYYRISYTSEYYQQLSDDRQQPLRYIDGHTLQDVRKVLIMIDEKERYPIGYPFDEDVQEYTTITDRDTAAAYIKQHRAVYEYIGYDTGTIDRILCVEITTINGRDRATAALYDHPEHGLIWLEMY